MFSINKILFYFFFTQFIFFNTLNAQIQVGASYGYNFDFGKNISDKYKSNTLFDLNLKYNNKTIFNPFISIMFTKIPLNYSGQIIKNQGDYKTIVINNSTSFKLGLETVFKNFEKSKLIAKFGFGVNFFSNPSVWIENSNESFGYVTNSYTNKTEKKFAFIDLSIIADRKISDNWTIYLDLGTQYYPKDNLVSIITQIKGKETEINSSFTKLRPYTKIGVIYTFVKK